MLNPLRKPTPDLTIVAAGSRSVGVRAPSRLAKSGKRIRLKSERPNGLEGSIPSAATDSCSAVVLHESGDTVATGRCRPLLLTVPGLVSVCNEEVGNTPRGLRRKMEQPWKHTQRSLPFGGISEDHGSPGRGAALFARLVDATPGMVAGFNPQQRTSPSSGLYQAEALLPA